MAISCSKGGGWTELLRNLGRSKNDQWMLILRLELLNRFGMEEFLRINWANDLSG
jgi:hypothetical protein